jgi:hypothetical protein
MSTQEDTERVVTAKRWVPSVVFALFGLATIAFGEADDAPGLVMLGLLSVVGAVIFGLKPALLTRSRVVRFILGAIVVTAIGSGIAGWLENNF